MITPFLLIVYILIFPGFLFLFGYALFLQIVDRRITARMQHRIGPPILQPLADIVKTLAKEVIDLKDVDKKALDAAPLLALAAVMTAYLYIPIVGRSPLAFQGDLAVVLYLLTLPTIILFVVGWLSRNIFATIGGVRAVTQMFIYEVPFFLALMTPALMAGSWSISILLSGNSTTFGLSFFNQSVSSLQSSVSRRSWRDCHLIFPRRRPKSLPVLGPN